MSKKSFFYHIHIDNIKSCIHLAAYISALTKKKIPNIIIAFVRTKAAGNITKHGGGGRPLQSLTNASKLFMSKFYLFTKLNFHEYKGAEKLLAWDHRWS